MGFDTYLLQILIFLQISNITKQQLQSYLWESANILRGKIDSGDFKHYILGLIFYKKLSGVFNEEFEKLKEQQGEDLALDNSLQALGREHIT